jgi:putative redox protein
MAIRVVRDPTAPMRLTVEIDQYRLAMEISAEEGSHAAGPNPHDLYDAALGACKALTVLWFAKRKGIPIENIEISVTRDNSQEPNGIYRLSADSKLTGSMAQGQRAELMQAARRCPVEKLMTEVKTEITTTWVET